jgi:hypothetical protein
MYCHYDDESLQTVKGSTGVTEQTTGTERQNHLIGEAKFLIRILRGLGHERRSGMILVASE